MRRKYTKVTNKEIKLLEAFKVPRCCNAGGVYGGVWGCCTADEGKTVEGAS